MPTTDHDETLDGLPQFAPPRGRPDPYATLVEDEPSPAGAPSTPTSPPPSTSWTPPPTTGPPPESPPTGRTTSSSPASSEISEGFEQLGTAIAAVSGKALNKATQRRGKAPHRRWIMTEEEAEGIGGALGRLAAKRVPEEIAEGDGAELLEIVTVGGAYLVRNALNVTDEDVREAQGPAPPRVPVFAPPPVEPRGMEAAEPTMVRTAPPNEEDSGRATQADPIIGLL